MMKPLFILVKIAVQMLVALFAFESLISHFSSRPLELSGYEDTSPQTTQPPSQTANFADLPTTSPVPGHVSKNTTYTTLSYTSPDELIEHFTLQRTNFIQSTPQSILYLTITKDEFSWGRNPTEQTRTLSDYLDLITNTTVDLSVASVGILTSSEEEFKSYKLILTKFVTSHPFNRVSLIYHQGTTSLDLPEQVDRGALRNGRYNTYLQLRRRSELAKLRNYLMSTALRDESHVLWLDADIYQLSGPDMVKTMMDKTSFLTAASGGKDVGILTARCQVGDPSRADVWEKNRSSKQPKIPPQSRDEFDDEHHSTGQGGLKFGEIIDSAAVPNGLRLTDKDGHAKSLAELEAEVYDGESADWKSVQNSYDSSAWRGSRRIPSPADLALLYRDRNYWLPGPAIEGNHPLDQLLNETEDSQLIQLDSVGGSVLMMRADLIRVGLNFATGYMVGMSWEHGEGWDGVETESLCLLSRNFNKNKESMCYAMGGDWAVWHTIY